MELSSKNMKCLCVNFPSTRIVFPSSEKSTLYRLKFFSDPCAETRITASCLSVPVIDRVPASASITSLPPGGAEKVLSTFLFDPHEKRSSPFVLCVRMERDTIVAPKRKAKTINDQSFDVTLSAFI